MESNLTVCENVGFEMRDNVPGLVFFQGQISRMDSCGTPEKEKADKEDDSN